MDLFGTGMDKAANLLPRDGEVNYFGKIMEAREAAGYLDYLLHSVAWKNDEAVVFGRLIQTKRMVAWYGDSAFRYTYSNVTKQALPWTRELQTLKRIVERHAGETFNSCLLNLYHDGQEGMAWHSDAEKDLKKNGTIASLSFGAERKFAFKHKLTGEKTSIVLAHGSLLLMKGATQTYWLHRLPPTKKILTPRINLTFRTIDGQQGY
ncbi:alpha-ketoglutarate-dependent dioxygenase AlkB family protein [Parapedobacter lycopersici]|uniref:alpha-ketoglutarate-dependent dioxygenase AlkB family protein n=1 Tax=Parapedobacter lycopersici TaxID=1864939 RepID=UPI00214D2EF7|nr:alpha-ketoglutarate-dependent dioxygenase AlkB [Parapedobacter lycopersici]